MPAGLVEIRKVNHADQLMHFNASEQEAKVSHYIWRVVCIFVCLGVQLHLFLKLS